MIDDTASMGLNIEFIEALYKVLEESSTKSITKKDFLHLSYKYNDCDNIYDKIDVNGLGYIKSIELATFLRDYEAFLQQSKVFYSHKLVRLSMPKAHIINSSNHSSMIDAMCFVNKPIRTIVTGSRDGRIYTFRATDLSPIATIDMTNKSKLKLTEMNKNIQSTEDRSNSKVAESIHKPQYLESKVGITVLHTIVGSSYICIGYADGTVVFYFMTTKEVHGRITDIPDPPTAMESYYITKTHTYVTSTITEGEPEPLVYPPNSDPSSANSSPRSASTPPPTRPIPATITNNKNTNTSTIDSKVRAKPSQYLAIGDMSGHLCIYSIDEDFRNSFQRYEHTTTTAATTATPTSDHPSLDIKCTTNKVDNKASTSSSILKSKANQVDKIKGKAGADSSSNQPIKSIYVSYTQYIIANNSSKGLLIYT